MGVCGCVRVYAGLHGCARVWTGVHRYVRVCAGLCRCVRVCMGERGCARVCLGVRVRGYAQVCACVWDEFSEFPPENRVPTSADFNTYPIRIFSRLLPKRRLYILLSSSSSSFS